MASFAKYLEFNGPAFVWGILVFLLSVAAPATAGMNPASLNFPRVTTVFGGTYDNGSYSAMCVACHTRSPSANPAATSLDNGSHFTFGGSGLATEPSKYSAEKLTVWLTTGGLSKYGLPGGNVNNVGVTGEMICESCHSMKYNTGKGKLLALDNAATDPSALCEGCHARTGPGHHPLTGEASSIYGRLISNVDNLFVRNPPTPESEATYPASDGVNCRSCHKPHDAQTKTGARILKRGYKTFSNPGDPVNGLGATGLERQFDIGPTGTPRLVTDYTPLCDACHKETQ